MSDKTVTVIGLGPMGRATVQTLIQAGHEVTVWNRTRSKADEIAEGGATPADTSTAAISANGLVLVSLIHHEAVRDLIEQVPDLDGRTIVNLSSGTPAQARAVAAEVAERGGAYLSGAYMTQSDDLRHPASRLYISGPEALYEEHRGVLDALVPVTHHLGEDHGLAQVYYQAGLAQFHAFATSFEQALAIVDASGADVDRFVDFATESPESSADFMRFFAEAAKGEGWGDTASLRMMDAGAQHVIDTAEDVGVDAGMTRTVQQYYRRALAASERVGRVVPVYQVLRGTTS